MKKFTVLIILFFVSLIAKGEDEKPEIDFYTNGQLMWLIDTTKIHSYNYDMYQANNPNFKNYKDYLDHANNDKRYKYNDWRLPTIEELTSLGLEDTFYSGFYRKRITLDANQGPYNNIEDRKIINMISIDTDTFYDYEDDCYWSSTQDINQENHFFVACFDRYRYKVSIKRLGWRSGHKRGTDSRSRVDDTGVYIKSMPRSIDNYMVSLPKRLVRDVSP